MSKVCEKCGQKPACVKSKRFPKLCFSCGIGPHLDANAKRSKLRAITRRVNPKPPPEPKPLFFK